MSDQSVSPVCKGCLCFKPPVPHPSQGIGLFPPDKITVGYFIFLLHVHTNDLKMMNEKGYYNPVQMPIHSSMSDMCSFWSKNKNVFVRQSQYFPAVSHSHDIPHFVCLFFYPRTSLRSSFPAATHDFSTPISGCCLVSNPWLKLNGYLASTAVRCWPVV